MKLSVLALFFVCFATLVAAKTRCSDAACVSCSTMGTHCYECLPGYALYDSSCYKCETNCTDCTAVFNNMIHVVCPYTDCKVPECTSCDSTGLLCLECASGYGVYNYSSCHSCPSSCTNCTAVEDPVNHHINTVCGYSPCLGLGGGCLSCDVNDSYCYKCESGYALSEGNCHPCPNNQWESCTNCICSEPGCGTGTSCPTDDSDE